MKSDGIAELRLLEDIEDLMDAYARRHGSPPFNVSHWDAHPALVREMAPLLFSGDEVDLMRYHYSYESDLPDQVMDRAGIAPGRAFLLTPSCTPSAYLLCLVLRASGIRRMAILAPTYFPVVHIAQTLGIVATIVSLDRHDGSFFLPRDRLDTLLTQAPEETALWVTSPVFSTGMYLRSEDIEHLRTLAQSGHMVVADECLAWPGREIAIHLGDLPHFASLFSPHKSICVNAMKFSAINAPVALLRPLNHYSDVVVGGLPASTIAAVRHYLGPTFDACVDLMERRIDAALAALRVVCSHFPRVDLDANPHSHFVSVYVPDEPSDPLLPPSRMAEVIENSGAAFIPGVRNHCPQDWGLSFRVNLALDSQAFRGAVGRLLSVVAA